MQIFTLLIKLCLMAVCLLVILQYNKMECIILKKFGTNSICQTISWTQNHVYPHHCICSTLAYIWSYNIETTYNNAHYLYT